MSVSPICLPAADGLYSADQFSRLSSGRLLHSAIRSTAVGHGRDFPRSGRWRPHSGLTPSQSVIRHHPDLFYGNAGNIYRRLNDYRRLRRLGTGVFAVSYRGYAKSEGSPSEAGIYRDGKVAFDYVAKVMGFLPSRIFIFGRSIGSTVATDLAQDKDIAGLILVSPLSSARDQASAMGLGFATPLVGKAFENDKKIKRLKAPLLVMHGTRDQIVPIGMGRKVFDAAISQKSFHEIEGAGHNNLSNRFAKSYWTTISVFLKQSSKNR